MIAALPAELRPLIRHTTARGRLATPPGGPSLLDCRIAETDAVLAQVGIGERRAEEAARLLLDRLEIGVALVVGFAGALSDDLESGDLVLATSIVAPEGEAMPGSLEELVALVARFPSGRRRVVRGAIATCHRVLRSVTEKADLHRQSGALACDMETAGVARALHSRGVPALYARAIVDEARLELPRGIERLVDPRGRLRPLGLLGLALSRPRSLIELRGLSPRARRAGESLAWLVREVAENLERPASSAEGQ